MHSKSRTSVLIIAAAITCVVLSFGLFSRGELLAAGAAGSGQTVCGMEGSPRIDLHDAYPDAGMRQAPRGTRLCGARPLKAGADREVCPVWAWLAGAAAFWAHCTGNGNGQAEHLQRSHPARYLRDLFTLYRKDGKKRRLAFVTI